MIDDSELGRMSPQERARLARALAALDAPAFGQDRWSRYRRRLVIAFMIVCMIALAAWIGVLEVTLPRDFRAGGWRAAWVGFDIGLLLVLGASAWAAWRRRQVLILCLVVLATLLCCDAWFDTTLDWGTHDFMLSLIFALAIELPLAAVALIGARRLLRLTIGRLEALEGFPGRVPSFWRVPLFGDSSAGYRDLLPQQMRRDLTGSDCSPRGETSSAPGEAPEESGETAGARD